MLIGTIKPNPKSESSMNLAVDILEIEEGYRENPYYCSEGYPTIGIGLKIGIKDAPLEYYTFTVPLSVARFWLQAEVERLHSQMLRDGELEAAMRACNPVRTAVLLSMAYQLGISGLKQFKKTLNHIERYEFAEAADEMLISRWADQTPERAERHSDMMEAGELLELKEFYRL